MKLQIQYPVFVVVRPSDIAPVTFNRPSDGAVAYALMETQEEADRLIAERGPPGAAAIQIDEPKILRGALKMAQEKSGATVVLLPRGIAPGSGEPVPAFPMRTVLNYVEEQMQLAKKASSN